MSAEMRHRHNSSLDPQVAASKPYMQHNVLTMPSLCMLYVERVLLQRPLFPQSCLELVVTLLRATSQVRRIRPGLGQKGGPAFEIQDTTRTQQQQKP